MKILLVIVASLFLQFGWAKNAPLPESSFSIDLPTGKWMESATEGETRRLWNGKSWEWEGNKKAPYYHYTEGKLTSVTPPGKAPIFYTYDAKGRLVKREEGDKHFIYLIYDDKGRVIEERAPIGKDDSGLTLSRFEYEKGFTRVIDPFGNEKVYHYNGSNEVIKIEHFIGKTLYKVEHFKWEEGLLKKQTLENAKGEELLVQKNIWGSSGKLKGQILTGDLSGRGKKETFTQLFHYNGSGVLKKITDDEGNILATPSLPNPAEEPLVQKNSNGLPTLTTLPNGASESYEWDMYGNMTARVTSVDGGKRTTFTYDYMNRLIRESDGFSFEYDFLGRQTRQIDPNGNATDFVFDGMGRMIEKIEPEVLDPQGALVRPRTTYKYNELDQMVETTNPDGWTTRIAYTARGQITRVEHPDGTVETVYYQLNGLREGESLEPETPPAPETEKEPLPPPPEEPEDPSHTTTYINDYGQVVLQKTFVDFTGIKSVRTFDALGRLDTVEKYDLLGQLFEVKKIRYTPAGLKALEIVNGEGVEWQWGPGEKLLAVVEGKGSSHERITRYEYDEKGRLIHLIKPSGITLSYSYTEEGALSALRSQDGSIDYAFNWNAQGRLSYTVNRKTGRKTQRFYNDKGILVKEILENGLEISWESDTVVLNDHSRIRYLRNADGILVGIEREDAHGHLLYKHNYTEFDPSGHLAREAMILDLGETLYTRDSEDRLTAIHSPYRDETLSYEGFLLKSITVDGKTRSFEYDAEFKLVRAKKPKRRYDLDGNTVESGGHTLSYDALGRLKDVDGEYLYDYDVFGRRLSKSSRSGKTLYLWDGMEEIGATDPYGTLKELKVMGSHGTVAVELDGTPYAALTDAKGSIAKLIGKAGEAASPWTYQGKRKDAETGFLYFGARYLDPVQGMFITPDPRGFADGRDLYHFARYNPNAFSDRFGHTAIWDSFKSLVHTGWNAWLRMQHNLVEFRSWMDNLSGMHYIHHRLEDLATVLLGKGFLIQSGYWRQERQTGVYGEGELNDKVRITFNHGILNIRSDLADNLRQISLSHGNCNVHYVFRPTQGFAWDLMKCLMVKSGYLSPEAKELIRIWKGLIEEMGGVEGGGKIVHYTHSVGGSDTQAALAHLSPEEQKMLDIRTFGSASLIPDVGTYQIVNYVSKRDGVSLFDPVHFFQGVFLDKPNIVFIGSLLGIPLVDHPLSVDSYQQIIRTLGQAFLETYAG
jgi:RHS repeat-associated protein